MISSILYYYFPSYYINIFSIESKVFFRYGKLLYNTYSKLFNFLSYN